jgi:hypothetical protein
MKAFFEYNNGFRVLFALKSLVIQNKSNTILIIFNIFALGG